VAPVHVNWLTVIVAAAIVFLIGAVWYSPPIFGKQWSEVVGKKPSPPALALSAATTLASAIMLAVLISWSGAFAYRWGALLGVIGWVAFSGCAAVANIGFEPTRSKLTVINTTYQLLGFVIMGALIGHWQ
jgi:Protein of unknown function (DUF1761)